MPDCIAIRLNQGPKLTWFQAPVEPPPLDAAVVVETKRGLEIGTVRSGVKERDPARGEFVRVAQVEDVHRQASLDEKANDLLWLARARAREVRPNDRIKIVSASFSLDERVLTITYSTEAKADLRFLVQAVKSYTDARIELVNVGPRDEARVIGTLGACGSGSCSSTWLQSFSTVSIRMARDQQLPLNPDKISGTCGRLMCCLQYEHEMYRELVRALPKKGSKACHAHSGACGKVVKVHALDQSVDLKTDDGYLERVPKDELASSIPSDRREG